MRSLVLKDNGGRRSGLDRRDHPYSGLILERRYGNERRDQSDRRKVKDPALRIVGDERRKAMRNLS